MKPAICPSRILNTLTWLVLNSYFAISSANFTKLLQDATFDGFVCKQNETVFQKTGVTETSCARTCHQDNGCISIFYSPVSNVCFGCMKRPTTVDVLDAFVGAQYHAKRRVQVSQWVQSVTAFSSQWDVADFCADQVIGPPNVYPSYGTFVLAWALNYSGASDQFIEVRFAEEVYIDRVEIYETWFGGGVKAIKALQGGSWTTLWSTASIQFIEFARIFAPTLSVMANPSRDIRIEIDQTCCSNVGSYWVQIDAIKLVGTK